MKRLILVAALALAVPAFAQDAAPAPDAAAPAAAPADATPPAPAAAPADVPVCSKKVTDRCIEKGSAPKKMWTKKKK